MNDRLSLDEQQALKKVVRRTHEQGWGISFGLLSGLALFIATNVLALRGGPVVGPHLEILHTYLPGYSVTFLGSLIGFIYAFVIGYGAGRLISSTYNRLTVRSR